MAARTLGNGSAGGAGLEEDERVALAAFSVLVEHAELHHGASQFARGPETRASRVGEGQPRRKGAHALARHSEPWAARPAKFLLQVWLPSPEVAVTTRPSTLDFQAEAAFSIFLHLLLLTLE